jgi:hypothetical protein
MDPVKDQVAGMMRWHERAVTTVAMVMLLLLLYLILLFVLDPIIASANSAQPLNLAFVFVLGPILASIILALCWLAICWAVIGWRIFRAGWLAFGVPAGAGYALLALVLLPFCGVVLAVVEWLPSIVGWVGVVALFWAVGIFAIPHMLRLNIQRLRG